MLGIWLGAMGVSQADADVAAAGWGGDRLSVAAGAGDEWGMAWRISWDTVAQATSSMRPTPRSPPTCRSRRAATTASNGDTLILHASSATVLDQMADALGG